MENSEIRLWINQSPRQAGFSLAWLIFQLILGTVGGYVILSGPFNWSSLNALFGGIVLGLIPTAFWAWERYLRIIERPFQARRLRISIIAITFTIIMLFGVVALRDFHTMGKLFFPKTGYSAQFERVWQAVDRYYPYFEQKDVDWMEIYGLYQPEFEEVEDDAAFDLLMASMMAELGDGHTNYHSNNLVEPCRFALFKELNQQIYVGYLGNTAQEAGLEVGSRILAVNGRPIEDVIRDVPENYKSGSTPAQSRYWALRYIIAADDQEEVLVSFQNPGEDPEDAILKCDLNPQNNQSDQYVPPKVESRILASGYGYIKIPNFNQEIADQFDVALDDLMDTPGIVIDIRGNGGGNSMTADQMAGRFYKESFQYGREYYRVQSVIRGWRSIGDYNVKPRGEFYAGNVVLLTNISNMSTAETFIVSMVDSGRAVAIGGQTAGSSGNPVKINLSDGRWVRFSTGDFRRNDGTSIEGIGITPDIVVEWSQDDIVFGNDPDLSAAENWFSSK
jgi:carboxyl-terminal processing protease